MTRVKTPGEIEYLASINHLYAEHSPEPWTSSEMDEILWYMAEVVHPLGKALSTRSITRCYCASSATK